MKYLMLASDVKSVELMTERLHQGLCFCIVQQYGKNLGMVRPDLCGRHWDWWSWDVFIRLMWWLISVAMPPVMSNMEVKYTKKV